jgi:hypothetical protein
MVAYDLWSRGRIHRSTTIAVTLITLAIFTMVLVAGTEFPHRVVEWIRRSSSSWACLCANHGTLYRL